MYHPTFAIAFFNGKYDYQHSAYVIYQLVNTLVEIDMYELSIESDPPIPPLYDSGVVFKVSRDEDGEESDDLWQDIFTVYAQKSGVCENLVAWRIAELRKRGIDANIHITQYMLPNGDQKFHIRVIWPNGFIEDPSKILGMTDVI